MNLEGFIASTRLKILSHKVIPLLVLIKQWSAQRDEAMMDTKSILYIIQTLQKIMSKHETDLTLSLMLKDINTIFPCSKYTEYINFLEMICTNLATFIELFEHLNSLISSTEKEDSMIDDKNGVIGGFIRFCIQEYQKLTFTQTVSLQKQWRQFYRNPECLKESLKIRKKSNREYVAEAKHNKEYTVAMEKLLLPSVQSKTAVELRALHMAMLLTQFDHIDECKIVLKEAIRMAQLSKNTPVLGHSLALLQRLTTVDPSSSKPMISQLIKNAEDSKENLLVSTGKLQLAKVEIQLDSDPKRVLDVLLSSEFDVFTCYDDYNHKSAVHSSALLLRASVFRQYGLRYLAVLPLQMLCHMTKSKSDRIQHRTLDESKAISLIALIIAEEGRFDEAIKMIEIGLRHYEDTKIDAKFLYHCLAELNTQKLFNEGDFYGCQKFLTNLAVYDPAYARYWHLRLLIHSEQLASAVELCTEELDKLRNRSQIKHDDNMFRARYLLALVEIFYKECLYSRAMEVALECLSFSRKHQLWEIVTSIKLKIASLQLQLCLISQSKNTINSVLLILTSHGVANETPLAFFTLAKIYLLERKDEFIAIRKFQHSDIQRALGYLESSLQGINTSLLSSPILKKISLLKDRLESQQCY